jgi:phosphatidylserine/phosphatidylglycerophosphate/cardiolipin synthase-like enzyme
MADRSLFSCLFGLSLLVTGCAADRGDGTETDTSWQGGKADNADTTGIVTVTEVHAHPAAASAGFVEVINTSDAPVDLVNCTLSVGTDKLALVAVDGHEHVLAPGQLAVVVDSARDLSTNEIPPDADIVTTKTGLGDLLAGSQQLIVRIAGVESDKADASKTPDDAQSSVERTLDDGFVKSPAGPTPGQQNDINHGMIAVYFAEPPMDKTDPIAPHLQQVIDGAQHTLDAAFFQVNNPVLIDAFVNAAARGVKVRFVTDTDYFTDPNYSAGYQKMVTAGIPVIDDKRSALMHSKFMVVDGEAVWTGSYNLIVPDHAAFDHADNALFIKSRQLAAIHTEQFEQLFGGKFGPAKHDAGHHDAFVDGVHVEVYFAPTDHLRDHALAAINKAASAVHFATFSFYQPDIGMALVAEQGRALDIRGMFDTTSTTGRSSQFPPLAMAGSDVRYADPAGPYLFLHDKFFVIDADTPEGTVITGSPNISDSAYGSNDEAMYIVHDRKLANSYDGAFHYFYDPGIGPNKH